MLIPFRIVPLFGLLALFCLAWVKVQPTTSVPTAESGKLFEAGLKDIYYAENRLMKKMEELVPLATDPELKRALEAHKDETRGHIYRLERIFTMLAMEKEEKKCKGIDGVLAEGDDLVQEFKGTPGLDQAIIIGVRKAEHYEVASYVTLLALARQLGQDRKVPDLLQTTLKEEQSSDEKLAHLFDSTAAMR